MSRPVRTPARAGWPVRALVGAQLTLSALYVTLLYAPVAGWTFFRDVVLASICYGIPGVLCLLRAGGAGFGGDRPRRAVRNAYFMFGLAAFTFTAGNFVYAVDYSTNSQPLPSWADAGFLASYPLMGAGTVLLARAELGRRLPVGVWIDGLVGALGVLTVGSTLGVQVVLRNLSGSPATLLVGTAYPVADLLLISMVIGVLALAGGRPGPTWRWLAAGLLVFTLGDTTYLWRVATNTYSMGSPLGLTWGLGLTLMAVAAWRRPPTSPGTDGHARSGAIVLAVGAIVAALAVLVAGHWVAVPSYTVALAGLTMSVAVLRTVSAFRNAYLLITSRAEARTDDLTGLGNRRAFYESAQATVSTVERSSVLLLDLDRFKEINDSLGHLVGDQLLREVSARLAESLRCGDHLSRLGGDEFVIVLPGSSADDAVGFARRLGDTLARPFRLDGLDLQITASIGVAAYPEHAADVTGLLQCADVAMYQAKSNRLGSCVYDASRDHQTRDRLTTIEQLRRALVEDQLVLHFQPQCAVRSGTVVGAEALVRWQHPEHGLLGPDEFLPLVEQTGLMPALTLHVLDRAVAQCADWQREGLELTVSVNLSTSNLLDERLPGQVSGILARHRVQPAALLLEVTESTLMVDPERATQTLTVLNELGVGLSVDDYGTGYCSLSYLRDLPVHELKLDKSFLQAATPGSRACAIVRSTIDLAHALGLRTVAEGVEDLDRLQLLRDENCDVAQGYFFTPPLPGDAFGRWLRARPEPVGDPFAEMVVWSPLPPDQARVR